MAEYVATVTVNIGFRAKNQEQAEERAQEIVDNIGMAKEYKLPTWFDDFNLDEVEVQEN